jgi:SRSO17 transposase
MPTSLDLDRLETEFSAFHARFAAYFFRREYRTRSARYLRALLSPVGRKNGWQLAEAMGERDPNGAQRLLFGARWDADAVRDELQRYVMERLGDPVTGVLVIDETGFLKKGTHSVGVARQYSGTAGKVENCQIGVFLTYASARGATFLDRRLYLPEHWAADAVRRSAAKVPSSVTFQTKPQLARAMLAHAFGNGVTAGWVAADSAYGCDRTLRLWLARRRQAYVVGVRRDERVWVLTSAGPRRQRTVAQVAAELVPADWQRLSAGDGAKGPRWYDWAWVPVSGLRQDDWASWLLIRRSGGDAPELAFFLVAGPAATTLGQAVRVAGQRWTIEQCVEEGKGETGLDEYEVRHWPSWHRHITLSMLAHAFLATHRLPPSTAEPASEDARAGGGGGTAVGTRSAPLAGADPAMAEPPGGAGLVNVATAAPSVRQTLPLPTTHAARVGSRPYLRL